MKFAKDSEPVKAGYIEVALMLHRSVLSIPEVHKTLLLLDQQPVNAIDSVYKIREVAIQCDKKFDLLASVRPGSHPHPGPQGWRVQLGETLSMEKTGKSHFPRFKHPRSFAFRFLKFDVLGIYKFFECLHCSNMFQPIILKIAIPLHILSAAVIHDLHVSFS